MYLYNLKKSVIWAHLFVVLYTVKLIAGGAPSPSFSVLVLGQSVHQTEDC
jgi:hypothetical protein